MFINYDYSKLLLWENNISAQLMAIKKNINYIIIIHELQSRSKNWDITAS